MSQPITFPPLPTWTAYADAVQGYEGLHDDLREAQHALDALLRARPAAEKQDAEAQATALRAGSKDPGPKFTKAWKDDVEAGKNRVRVLNAAVVQQEQAVRALLRENAEQAAEAAEQAYEAAAERYRRALADVVNARDEFFQTGRTVTWAKQGTRCSPLAA
jgi:prophage DNA circulation protein